MSSIQWLQLPFALVTPGQVLAAGIVLPLVCIACVGLRFYVRRLQKTSPGVDDWLIAVGVVFIAGMGACLIIGERLGVAGYPTPVPDGTDASEASGLFLEAYIEFALQFIQVFAYGFVKASVVCFCRRIFVGHKNSAFDWVSKVLIAMVVLWSVGFWMALVVGCGKSVELHWAPLQVLVEAGCDASTPEEAMVISDLILDLFILILPLPAIWKLNMSVGRKYAVTGIFLFGIMSIAASAARVAIYLTVLYQGYSAGHIVDDAMVEHAGSIFGRDSCMPADIQFPGQGRRRQETLPAIGPDIMSETGRFVASAVDFDRDWDALFYTYWESWKQPLQAAGQLTFAGIGKGGDEEAASFAATKKEYLAAARANPNQQWVKVEDLKPEIQGASAIVGGGAWTTHGSNPFRADHYQPKGRPNEEDEDEEVNLPGPGFEPGSERHSLAQQFYRQLWSWRPKLMNAAHIYGQALWVLPAYRRTGAASAVMRHWTSAIDDSGLEAYLEGSSMSTPLYRKHGFIVVERLALTFHRDDPSPDWQALVRDMQSQPISIMWRPEGGQHTEGKTVLPWLGRARETKL
ncbi:putative GNAT family acetyltransferase [Seiridium cardinale]